MRKLFVFLFTLGLTITGVSAQQFHTEYSPAFDEPEAGWSKVMQLTNGNTFFFQFNKADGIRIRVYDKTRKIISVKTLKSGIWDADKMGESTMEGLYEIKGQPVVFLQQLIDRTPTLFRIVFDAQTGAVVTQTKLGELQPYGAFAGYAAVFGHVDPNNSYIEKDPASDCYAVAYFNGFAHETNARIEVVHYDGDHKEINRAFYKVPGDKYKYIRLMGMSVDADRQVYVATYGFNSRGDEDSRVIISRLKKDEKEFTHNMLDFSEDFSDTKGVMQYNPATKLIQLMTITKTESKHHVFSNKTTQMYLPLMTYINPENLKVVGVKVLQAQKTAQYATTKLQQDGYTGLPQNMILNNDHSTTILMEEMSEVTSSHSYGGNRMYGGATTKTELQNIGVLVLNDTGGETNGYAILKSQQADGEIPTMYLSEKSKGYWSYRHRNMMKLENNPFMSYDYVNTDKANYILFNDYPVNTEKEESKKRKTVQTISGTNTMVYTLGADGNMSKQYLFGDPKDDDKSTFSYIEASSYLKPANTYATLIVKRDGREKKAKIAWVTFE